MTTLLSKGKELRTPNLVGRETLMKVASPPYEAGHRQAREGSHTVQIGSPAVRATKGANGHDVKGALQDTVQSRTIRSVMENVNVDTEPPRCTTRSAVKSVNAITVVPPKEKESVVSANRTSSPGQATTSEEGLTPQDSVIDKIIRHGEAEDGGRSLRLSVSDTKQGKVLGQVWTYCPDQRQHANERGVSFPFPPNLTIITWVHTPLYSIRRSTPRQLSA